MNTPPTPRPPQKRFLSRIHAEGTLGLASALAAMLCGMPAPDDAQASMCRTEVRARTCEQRPMQARTTVVASPGADPTFRSHAGIGSELNPTGNPIGGGHGYSQRFYPGGANTQQVNDTADLMSKLETLRQTPVVNGVNGPIWRVLYLNPNGNFNLDAVSSNAWFIDLPDYVVLASNRGHAAPGEPDGALLYTTLKHSLFKTTGHARFVGLRVQGADPSDAGRDGAARMRGLYAEGRNAVLEVDNCEVSGFDWGAIMPSLGAHAYVHHNFIHHNRRSGLGYGVVLDQGGTATVIANLFNYNRHAIASDGLPGGWYEAAWNTVQSWQNGHAFDVHGYWDRCEEGDPRRGSEPCTCGERRTTDANEWTYVHHNTFIASDHNSVDIRGRATDCTWIENNRFGQTNHGIKVDHVWWRTNVPVTKPWLIYPEDRIKDVSNIGGYQGLVYSAGGTGAWNSYVANTPSMSDMKFGDFDGDGIDDILYIRPSDSHWLYSFSRWRSLTIDGWTDYDVRVPGLRARDVEVADFTGDGYDDIFYTTGWHMISSRGTAPFTTGAFSAAGVTLPQLRFGDFNHDGKTDVLRAASGTWKWSPGGTATYRNLNTMADAMTNLRIGDFVGDDRDDVFRTSGGQWQVSDGGAGPWQWINSSSASIGSLRFGDFDANGRTDVFEARNGTWNVSWGGTTAWAWLGTSSFNPSGFAIADLNGDDRDDVLSNY